MKQLENNAKVSFLRRVKWSICNPENYDFFALENYKKAFAYFAKLLLLFSFIISTALTIKLATSYDETITNMENTLKLIGDGQTQISLEAINQIKSLSKLEVCLAFYLISEIYLFIMYFISIIIDILLLSLLRMVYI